MMIELKYLYDVCCVLVNKFYTTGINIINSCLDIHCIAVEGKLKQPGVKRKSIVPTFPRKSEISQDPTAQELKNVFAPSYRDVCIDMDTLWFRNLSIKLP